MLDKRALRKIPCEEAGEDIVRAAEGELPEFIRSIMTAKFTDKGKKILLLTFYRVEDLRANKKKAVMRTFLSKDDYITQDMRVSNAKWLTGSFERMNDPVDVWCWWHDNGTEYKVYIMPECEKTMTDFFGKYAEKQDKSIWRAVFRFQERIRTVRLSKRHNKKKEKIDAVMDKAGEIPQGFKKWCKETVLGFSRYLIYKDIGGGRARCRCTHCEHKGEVDRSEVFLKHKAETVCPFCKSKVSAAAEGRIKTFHDRRRAAFVEPFENGFMLRIFECHREGGTDKETREYMLEDKRMVYYPKENSFERHDYEYSFFKNTNEVRWCNDTGRIYLYGFCLYPGNLPQAWEHTAMKYSALEILSEKTEEPMNFLNAISVYLKFPKIEWIIKMGLTKLAREMTEWRGMSACDLNEEGQTIYEILGLKKPEVRILQRINGGSEAMKVLRRIRENRIKLTDDETVEFITTFGLHNVFDELKRTTFHKLMRFINRECADHESERECGRCLPMSPKNDFTEEAKRKQNLASDWLDYLRWRREMHRDIKDEFNYFPKNFKAVHEREQRDYLAMKDRQKAEERALEERRFKLKTKTLKAVLEDVLKSGGYKVKGEKFVIVVPTDPEEIRKEGETLHHCVATYIGRVASGRTNIFFVRRISDPLTPFYTLEYNSGRVVQCRGKNNKGMTADVAEFVNGFAKTMLEKAEEIEKNGVKAAI